MAAHVHARGSASSRARVHVHVGRGGRWVVPPRSHAREPPVGAGTWPPGDPRPTCRSLGASARCRLVAQCARLSTIDRRTDGRSPACARGAREGSSKVDNRAPRKIPDNVPARQSEPRTPIIPILVDSTWVQRESTGILHCGHQVVRTTTVVHYTTGQHYR